MKRINLFLVFLLIISVTAMFAANGVKLVKSDIDRSVLKFQLDDYKFNKVNTLKGTAVELVVPKAGKIMQAGAPELPRMSASVVIPDEAEMGIRVLSTKYIDIPGVEIAPSKGNLLRNIDPQNVPYEYGAQYQVDAFFPANIAQLRDPHILRDFRGQTIIVHPMQYNPVTKVLRIHRKIEVEIANTGQIGKNILKRNKKATKKIDKAFRAVYGGHFENLEEATLRYSFLGDAIGNYLIVCYNGFMSNMADFVSWKQQCGYTVDLVDYSTIGSSTALKTYVANYYNTNGLTFLLLVGDHAQIPTSSTSAGDSDQNYGYIVGSDHYVDILVGRFSAENTGHVDTQVERTIHYERDVLASQDFFKHAIGMGSSEGPGQDGEYDYEHINNILADCAGIGYTTHECHQAGGSAALMSSLINDGAGVIWYCGHGGVTQWYTASWSYYSSDVDALVNEYELPFVISVACVVGDFATNTCFCETWQRATNNGNPTGSIAHCGSTINQSWIPPMDAEDEMADLMVAGSVRTFGGMFVNGLFKMIDLNGSGGEDMADTWTCFGDASVQLRTTIATNGPDPSGNIPPNADYSYSDNLLTVTFTDLSTDSDGTIVGWDWDFGDGSAGSTAQNPVHTFPANGTYTVTLTVEDDGGAFDSEVKQVYVTDGSIPDIYVYDISQSIASKPGKRYQSTATITIKDTEGNFADNATVYITWSGVASGSDSATTGSGGTVTFLSDQIRSTGPFIITVDNVTHPTLNYTPALNNETSDTANY